MAEKKTERKSLLGRRVTGLKNKVERQQQEIDNLRRSVESLQDITTRLRTALDRSTGETTRR